MNRDFFFKDFKKNVFSLVIFIVILRRKIILELFSCVWNVRKLLVFLNIIVV